VREEENVHNCNNSNGWKGSSIQNGTRRASRGLTKSAARPQNTLNREGQGRPAEAKHVLSWLCAITAKPSSC
jgi:hypothetical protein